MELDRGQISRDTLDIDKLNSESYEIPVDMVVRVLLVDKDTTLVDICSRYKFDLVQYERYELKYYWYTRLNINKSTTSSP